jgi:PAS domain S-box-containing protein
MSSEREVEEHVPESGSGESGTRPESIRTSSEQDEVDAEILPSIGLLADRDFTVLSVLSDPRPWFDRDPAALVGTNLWSVLAAADAVPAIDEVLVPLAAPGTPSSCDVELRDPTGDRRSVRATLYDLRTTDGFTGYALGLRDTTRERVETSIRRRQESVLAIAGRLLGLGGWSFDLASQRLTLSSELQEVLGRSADRPVSIEEAFAFIAPEDQLRLYTHAVGCLEDGRPFDLEVDARDQAGGGYVLRFVGEAERDRAGAVVGLRGGVIDVTDQRRTERRLREQAALLDQAGDAIVVIDSAGAVTFWNAAAEQLYGWTRDEVVGRDVAMLRRPGREQLDGEIEGALRSSGEWVGRRSHVDRDGREFLAEIRLSVLRDPGAAPGVLAFIRDVSHQSELEERLAAMERLEALGTLTGGVAHDVNNLLTVINGATEMIALQAADDPQVATLTGIVLRAAEQGAQLAHRLLAFGRRQRLRPELVDPIAIVEELAETVRHTFPEPVTVVVDRPDRIRAVSADVVQIRAALMNLVVNARDATDGRGTITLQVREEPGRGGDEVVFAVADDGPGMPPEVRDRAFEPFFTTKAAGVGTGLGLSMVFGFARQSGGTVELRSEPDRGTTVELRLPGTSGVVRTPSDPTVTTVAAEPVIGHGERVLVVEDEPMVRAQTAGTLRRLGYEVVEVGDGAAALEFLGGDARVDLVLSDVVMPGGPDGVELALTVSTLRPGLPVVLTSGYTEGIEIPADVVADFLPKPYRSVQLAAVVRGVLDRRRADA